MAGSHYHIAYGGKGDKQVVAAARLGGDVSFIACIGDDDIGRAMKNAFEQDGIHTESITQIQHEMSGIAMIQVAENGENSIIISAGANGALDEKVVEHHQAVIRQSDCLLMQLETPLNAVIRAAKIVKAANNTKVILNPAPA